MRLHADDDVLMQAIFFNRAATRVPLLVHRYPHLGIMYLCELGLFVMMMQGEESMKHAETERQLGGLIFYYISDTHNIQKRQTEAEKLYYITLFPCSHLFRLHTRNKMKNTS